MYRRQTFQKNVSMPFGTNRVLVAASPQPSFTFLSPLSLSLSLSLSVMAQQPPVCQGLLIIEASRSHSRTTLGRALL